MCVVCARGAHMCVGLTGRYYQLIVYGMHLHLHRVALLSAQKMRTCKHMSPHITHTLHSRQKDGAQLLPSLTVFPQPPDVVGRLPPI